VAATRFANNIISMMDSREKTARLIQQTTERLASGDVEDEVVDSSLGLEELHALAERLEKKISNNVKILTGKDAATAAAISKAVLDDYLAKRLKARAILMRVHQKVKDSVLVALPYKRRISRAKRGVSQIRNPTVVSPPLPDIKIRKKTEDSMARRIPGIRELARRYNAFCVELDKHPNRQKHASASVPAPLDVDQLFDPEAKANQHMWTEQGLEEGGGPPGYLHDPKIREGISAVLVLDRAEEEEHRLAAEASAMVQWLGTQLTKTNQALQLCKGVVFFYYYCLPPPLI
jgi:hypothetical protein